LSSASRGTHGISCERDRALRRRHLSVGCELILQPASAILAALTGFELLPDPEEGTHHVCSEFLQSFRTASPIRRDSAADGFHQGRSVSVKETAHAQPVVCDRSALLVDSRNIVLGAGDWLSDVQRCSERRLLDSVGRTFRRKWYAGRRKCWAVLREGITRRLRGCRRGADRDTCRGRRGIG
jgi:hypothetical protein